MSRRDLGLMDLSRLVGETDLPPLKKSQQINHLELNTFPQEKEQDAIRKWDGEGPYPGWEASEGPTFVRPKRRPRNWQEECGRDGAGGETAGMNTEQMGSARCSEKLRAKAGLAW